MEGQCRWCPWISAAQEPEAKRRPAYRLQPLREPSRAEAREEKRGFASCDRDAGHGRYILPTVEAAAAIARELGCAARACRRRAWLGAWRLMGRAKEGLQASERRQQRRFAGGAGERRPCSWARPQFVAAAWDA